MPGFLPRSQRLASQSGLLSMVGFVCAQLAEAAGGAHTAWEDHTLVKFRHVRVGYRKLGKEPAASEPGHGQKYCFESSRH